VKLPERVDERDESIARRNKDSPDDNDPPRTESIIHPTDKDERKGPNGAIEEESKRNGSSAPAKFGNHRFKHHPERVSGPRVKEEDGKASRQDVPAIMDFGSKIFLSQRDLLHGFL
jgi:hypothetical protein